jgi:hypothetical protein
MKHHVRLTSEQWHEMYDRMPDHYFGFDNFYKCETFDDFYKCETDEIKCLNTDGTDHYLVFESEQDAIVWTLKYL